MAKVMSYTPPASATTYPNSYWVVSRLVFNPPTSSGMMIFSAWATAADYQAGNPQIPGANHTYMCNVSNIPAFNNANAPNFSNLEVMFEAFAASVDSFFNGAITVD